MAKSSHKNKKSKLKKAGMFAAPEAPKKHACGKKVYTPDPERSGPTPETKRRLREDGPTCEIQRLVWQGKISEAQSDAIHRYARLLATAGLLGKAPQSWIKQLVDNGGGSEVSPERREEAMRAVRRDIWPALDGHEVRHLGRVCRQERSDAPGHVANGAKTLVKLLIGGERNAA